MNQKKDMAMDSKTLKRKNLIAQWAFDTLPVLSRFHLWLEDIDIEWLRGQTDDDLNDSISFVDPRTEKMLAMTSAVTALGTKLFGRYGEGAGLDKNGLDIVKKDADAISAYAMSESLWYLSRSLPENHAIMVCLGEGLMAKAGETEEMGANPLLGFGRIYARPQVAKFLESCIRKLINDRAYTFEQFQNAITKKEITVWGAAIDTLENTSRFAKGKETGPLTVFHLFDQPLAISDQYEGYIGNLVLPQEVVDTAADHSVLINFFTPRKMVVGMVMQTYPGIKPEHIHVWTLTGKSRENRIGHIWKQWRDSGAHLVDDTWTLPSGMHPFTDSGTYAPTFSVKTWEDNNKDTHLFIVDGYAASAEAIQGASLAPILGLNVSLAVLSSKFAFPCDRDAACMKLNPDAPDFNARMAKAVGKDNIDDALVTTYNKSIKMAKEAGIPLDLRTITCNDIIAKKSFQALAASGYMLPDPYSGSPGVEEVSPNTYRVTVRLTTPKGDKRIYFTLRLQEEVRDSKLVFSPLLNRFLKGEDFKTRAVKISDSGRIRNELQTLCMDALEYYGTTVVLQFSRISKAMIPLKDQQLLRQILTWYKDNYPVWFEWLELKE